jgi:2-polyprenyl-6-methoxyphenol hydroxylase-like FAD-dependent oxidoreductase
MPAEIVVLGGGVGGTLVANLLDKRLAGNAHVTVVDPTGMHDYQPGYLTSPSVRPRGTGSLARNDRSSEAGSTWRSRKRSGSIPTPAPCNFGTAGASRGTTS